MQTPPCYPACTYCSPVVTMSEHCYEVDIVTRDASGAEGREHLGLASPSDTPAEAAKAVRDYLRHANRADIGTFTDVSDGE